MSMVICILDNPKNNNCEDYIINPVLLNNRLILSHLHLPLSVFGPPTQLVPKMPTHSSGVSFQNKLAFLDELVE